LVFLNYKMLIYKQHNLNNIKEIRSSLQYIYGIG
jgi:hypothetical protein